MPNSLGLKGTMQIKSPPCIHSCLNAVVTCKTKPTLDIELGTNLDIVRLLRERPARGRTLKGGVVSFDPKWNLYPLQYRGDSKR